MIDLNGLKRIALENAEKRQKNGANITTDTREMLKHCATEAEKWQEIFMADCDERLREKKVRGSIPKG